MVHRVLDQSISAVNHHGAIEAKGIIQRITQLQWGRAELLPSSPPASLAPVPAPAASCPSQLHWHPSDSILPKTGPNTSKGPACRGEVMDHLWMCSQQPYTHPLVTRGFRGAHLAPGLVPARRSSLTGSWVGSNPLSSVWALKENSPSVLLQNKPFSV